MASTTLEHPAMIDDPVGILVGVAGVGGTVMADAA